MMVPVSPHPRQHLLLLVFFNNSHADRCDVISHGGFDFHFPDDWWYWVPFRVPVGHPYVFFGKRSIQILCSYFNQIIFCCWVVWVLYIFWILTPYCIWFANIFFHSIGCLFILLVVLLCCAEAFSFDVVPLVCFYFCCLCFWCQIQKIITKTDVKELNTCVFF